MHRDRQAGRVDRIELLAIGPVATELLEAVATRLSRRVPVACHVRTDAFQDSLPYLRLRNQLDADGLLHRLEASAPGCDCLLVGVAGEDLGSSLFAHMFGQARLQGPAAVVSIARLTPTFYGLPADRELTVERTVREIIHELGHCAGLKHCRDFECVMHRADAVETIDIRGAGFCAACEAGLPTGLGPR
jgi:archaemetzincin